MRCHKFSQGINVTNAREKLSNSLDFDPRYVAARRVLLDELTALAPYGKAFIVAGAPATMKSQSLLAPLMVTWHLIQHFSAMIPNWRPP